MATPKKLTVAPSDEVKSEILAGPFSQIVKLTAAHPGAIAFKKNKNGKFYLYAAGSGWEPYKSIGGGLWTDWEV
jgi:hypothetical protein